MTATIASVLTVRHSGAIARQLVGLVLGLVMTTGLFWIMQYLIATADRTLKDDGARNVLDFIRVPRDEDIQTKPKIVEKPPKPKVQPPPPSPPNIDNVKPNPVAISIPAVKVNQKIISDPFQIGTEGDYLPIVKVAPIYPNRALTRGVEGFCVVQYTVTNLGTTKDPFVVTDQCDSSLFHRASVNAALKFKYKPRIIDGEAVEVPGVQNKFTYEITE